MWSQVSFICSLDLNILSILSLPPQHTRSDLCQRIHGENQSSLAPKDLDTLARGACRVSDQDEVR
jgi:hypothetical protein